MPSKAPGPLFIVSMWRGGSSLLHVLLNKHPQVALMFEADLLLLRPVFRKPRSISDWRRRWQLWNQTFTRHALDSASFADVAPEFRSVFEAVHQQYAHNQGATIWGDKSPNYHDQLAAMARAFPAARFIIVWRDPAETIAATLRAAANGSRYFRKRGMPERSLLGYRIFKRQCREIVASGAAVHELHYEDLITDTANTMRGVCRFLEIPFHENLCTLEGADRSTIYAGRHHNLLRENTIVKDRNGKDARPEALPSALRRKVERYANLWHESDPGTSSFAIASYMRLQVDQLRYRLYRMLDSLIRLGFCFLPMSLLRAYRRGKERAENAINTSLEPPATETQP
jgi:hypothetical protein